MTYLAMTGGLPWLSIMLFLPLVGAVLAAAGPAGEKGRIAKWGSFALSLAPLGIALYLAAGYRGATVDNGLQQVFQYAERLPWISVLGIEYRVGLDGISLPLVLLTTFMTPLAILAAGDLKVGPPRYFFALILLMETAMLGVFLALNFFLFFIFWEISLIPGYYLIAVWGRERRRYAAFKFFVYTMAGSVGMLLAFELFYLATAQAGRGTFDLVELSRLAQGLPVVSTGGNVYAGNLQSIVYSYLERIGVVGALGGAAGDWMGVAFWMVFIALAIKLAVWPFHTWLPDAYGEAPTAGSMLLAGVLTKMGAFAMLRLMLPIFPAQMQAFAPVLGLLAFASIVVGAWVAYGLRNGDLKRLISYLSINHMGYVMLAIAAAGAARVATADGGLAARATAVNGAVMQMFAHGLSTGALFYLAGLLAERTGTYNLDSFRGLLRIMPVFVGVMGVAMFGNLGLPGMAGFVGEFFIFNGTWATLPLLTILSMAGLVISALALLVMYQRIFFGETNWRWHALPDLKAHEAAVLVPLLGLLIVLGVYPMPLMQIANQTALAVVRFFAG